MGRLSDDRDGNEGGMSDPDPTEIREEVAEELEELVEEAAEEERERMAEREAEGIDRPSD